MTTTTGVAMAEAVFGLAGGELMTGDWRITILLGLALAPLLRSRASMPLVERIGDLCSAAMCAVTLVLAADIVLGAIARGAASTLLRRDCAALYPLVPFVFGGLIIEIVREMEHRTPAAASAVSLAVAGTALATAPILIQTLRLFDAF